MTARTYPGESRGRSFFVEAPLTAPDFLTGQPGSDTSGPGWREAALGQPSAIEGSRTEIAGGVTPDGSPAWARLEDQIAWYDAKSRRHQRWFKRLKVVQLLTAAAIPVGAGVSAPAWLVGGAGAAIVFLEGLQQLGQYQQNWAAYRSTCERLKHEKFLFLARAGPYTSVPRAEVLLAERVEGLVSQEHAAWVTQREEAARRSGEAK